MEAEELKRGRIRDATSNRGKVAVTDKRQTQERAPDNRSALLAVYQHFFSSTSPRVKINLKTTRSLTTLKTAFHPNERLSFSISNFIHNIYQTQKYKSK